MRVLFLESFYGGSHREVLDELVAHSAHDIDTQTLPARFWKWRVRGSAAEFIHRIPDPSHYDLVALTGLTTVSDLRSFWGSMCPPILLYEHETQLSYPVPQGQTADANYGFTDVTNMIAADHVAFNSHTHRDQFLGELPRFLRKFPDNRPMWAVPEIEAKSSVLYPGIRYESANIESADVESTGPKPGMIDHKIDQMPRPLIVWNHRWEFDKDPDSFFSALRAVKATGRTFSLAVLGENFQMQPKAFISAKEEFSDQIVQWGYLPAKSDYRRWLTRGDIVVSTSIQENFGISVLEAVAYGCWPLLPDRLSYPEIIPDAFHPSVLYNDVKDLVIRLLALIDGYRESGTNPGDQAALMDHARSFVWERQAAHFDALFEAVATG